MLGTVLCLSATKNKNLLVDMFAFSRQRFADIPVQGQLLNNFVLAGHTISVGIVQFCYLHIIKS